MYPFRFRVLTMALLSISIFAKEAKKDILPIVLVHGILSDRYGMAPTEHYIKKYLGEHVYIKNVQIGFGEATSLVNLYYQAEHLREVIQSDPNLKGGFNLIAHSQGGLVARHYIQKYNNPQVQTFITWGTPHQGVFGFPGTFDERFIWLDYMEGFAHKILYSKAIQKTVGFAGYWHDTLHQDLYLKKAVFLPYLNNEIAHENEALFKKNLSSLKNMVLVMSENETIIEPKISCHFGFYKKGSKEELELLLESDIYKQDKLGLKQLDHNGRLHLLYAECTHENFQEDEKNFVENTLPFLQNSKETVA